MTNPGFRSDGFLPNGVHKFKPDEFLAKFCQGAHRSTFDFPMRNIITFAVERGAVAILVGGSFVSNKLNPRDLDCVLVFEREAQIPERSERLAIDGTRLDVFFCSYEDKAILAGFVEMFSNSRFGTEVGTVQIVLQGALPDWAILSDVDPRELEIVRRVYINHHVLVERNPSHRALVTVHGIRTHAEWNAEIAHIGSSNGWIVAPYVYGRREFPVLFNQTEVQDIVDGFRRHVDDIQSRYSADISVIAHSFGTYVAFAYLLGFDVPPVPFDNLLLTGSIIDENFNIDELEGRAWRVINEVAPNDDIVELSRFANTGLVPRFGKSGQAGFVKASPRLIQREADIFSHTNVIRRDVVAKRWMPMLEVGAGRGREEAAQVGLARMKATD